MQIHRIDDVACPAQIVAVSVGIVLGLAVMSGAGGDDVVAHRIELGEQFGIEFPENIAQNVQTQIHISLQRWREITLLDRSRHGVDGCFCIRRRRVDWIIL